MLVSITTPKQAFVHLILNDWENYCVLVLNYYFRLRPKDIQKGINEVLHKSRVGNKTKAQLDEAIASLQGGQYDTQGIPLTFEVR